MKTTVVELENSQLFENVKVRNKKNGQIRIIKVLPNGSTISECVKNGIFDISKNINLETVLLNKNRFELI